MPSPTRTLTQRSARRFVGDVAFPPDVGLEIGPARGPRVGLEVEWFTTPSHSPPSVEDLRTILDPVLPLPAGSAVTYEPGGQLEISSLPFASLDDACDAVCTDRDVVAALLARRGIGLIAAGIDDARPDRLVTSDDRYVAMKAYFDRMGPAGRRMMCTTAAIHVNVDAGRDQDGRRRWRLAHRLGPLLVAAFADSPSTGGGTDGWKSERMAAWLAIDPTRTAPVTDGLTDDDPVEAWASYALSANVMLIRSGGRYLPLTRPLPFSRWIDEGHELGYPTAEDLAYHLTTLFPPVRPHGRLELRMVDMVADPWWRAAAGVATALLYDEEAAAAVEEATDATAGLWADAARHGLDHPLIAGAVQACFAAAVPALERMGCGGTAGLAAEYGRRYVERGRTPADDRLQARHRPKTTIAEAI